MPVDCTEECKVSMSEDVVQKAKQHASAASLASLDGDLEVALSELILATECYAEGIRATTSKQERKTLFSLFDECADEAERVKERQRNEARRSVSNATLTTNVVRQPVCVVDFNPEESRTITRKEQVVLLKSSKIGDRVYPLWNAENISSHLQLTEPYTDDVNIFEQETTGQIRGWQRMLECIPQAQLTNDDMIIHTTLSQAVLNDCSLVASLIVASQWSTRFRTRLMTSTLFPQNELGEPIVSEFGKYMLKVHLNGAFRQVVLDDRLPVDESGTAQKVLAFSAHYPNVCWPALVHKAFRKIRGPNFQGSNSASDLRLLTGWIPEEINLRGQPHDLEALWTRLYQPWIKGDVLITLGTGKLSAEEREDSGLVSEHNYAVTQLRCENGARYMTIQNPWRTSERDVSLEYKTIFDMEFSQILYHFATLFLNWNPTLWKYQITTHFQVSQDQFSLTDNLLVHCPQFVLTNTAAWTVKVCLSLSSHLLSTTDESTSTPNSVYSSLSVFDNQGDRVYWPVNPILSTDYHGSSELTAHISVPGKTSYTIVLVQRNAPPTQTQTLVAYHNEYDSVISFSEPRDSFKYEQVEWGHWTGGGNPSLITYAMNPQYLLTCGDAAATTRFLAILETDADVYVNVDVVYTHHRPLKLTRKDVVVSGKEYRQHHQIVRTVLHPGPYTVVVSTFKAHRSGRFKLSLFTDEMIHVTHVKDLGAGLSKKVIKSHWSTTTSTGGSRRQRFEILVSRSSLVTFHIHPSVPVWNAIKVSHDDETSVAAAVVEGKGSLGLDKLPLQKKGRWMIDCELKEEYKGDLDFEVQIFSDSVLQIQRC